MLFRSQGAGPEGPVVEGGPGRRGPGVPGGGSPRDAVPRGADADAAEEARLARQPAGLSPRLLGASVSARLPWRWAGGGRGCAEKRSALSLAEAPGPPRRWLQSWARLCLPCGEPGHGVSGPEPLGRRAGLGAARRRPALTAARCPAPAGAEAAHRRPSAFRMLIKEYHIVLPMSLDEYQVAQL